MNEPSTKLHSMDDEFLRRLDAIIEEHLENVDFGVEKLAEEMAISRSQLHRRLQIINGKSASRYIRSYKLAKAKALLEAKAARVSEISTDLGFSNPAYFTKVFTEEFGYPPSKSEANRQPGKSNSPTKNRNLIYSVSGASFLVFALAAYYFLYTPDKFENSIAVLPFNNYSSDQNYDFLSDGVTEDIIGQLASIPELKVISRTSSSLYKNTDKSVTQIAEELDVNHVLEGSIRKEGRTVRVVVQLVDALKDRNIWVESYDLKGDDLLAVPVEISQKIALTLKGKIKKNKLQMASYFQNIDPAYYEMYTRARFLEYQYSKEVTHSAIQLYQDLIEMDSTFGPAYSGLAACYIIQGTWTSMISTSEAISNIQPNIEKAKLLAPDFFHTQAADGMLNFFFLRNYKKAEKSLRRSLELDPTKSIVRAVYIHYLNMMGRFPEARKQWQILNDYDPNSFWNKVFAGETDALDGNYQKAIDFYKAAIKDVPYHPLLHDRLGWSYLLADSVKQSVSVLENAIKQFNMKSPSILAYLGIGYHRLGAGEKESEIIAELRKMCKNKQPNCAGWIATYFAGIGKTKKAKEWLTKAKEGEDVRLIWQKVDPFLKDLEIDGTKNGPSISSLQTDIQHSTSEVDEQLSIRN